MIFLLFGFYTASSSSSSSRFWYNALSSRFWRIVSNYISFLSCSVIYTLLSSSWLSNPSSSSSLLSAFFRRFSFISSSIIFILRSRIESKSVLSAWANRANRLSYSNSFDGGCEILLFLWISLAFFQNVLFHLLQSLIHSYSSFLF